MTWIAFAVLSIALMALLLAVSLIHRQRRPSLTQITRELRSMHLGREPRLLLEWVLRSVARVLDAAQIILFYYDSETEQLYRWDFKRGDAQPALTEVPPRELDAWISMERSYRAELLGPDAPMTRRLGAKHVMSVRFAHGLHTGRLLVVDPRKTRYSDVRRLHTMAVHLGFLIEQFAMVRRVRIKTIDEERARIARDFHDGPLQTYLSMDLHLAFVRKLMESDPARAATELEQLRESARNQGRELRDVIQEMRPIDMDNTTLLGLLRSLVVDLQKSGDLAIQLVADSHFVDAPRRVSREVYQIVREAVTNARKHAQPRNVVIAIDAQPDELRLTIDDDGKGFAFSGSYGLEELDRLRVGPVSIKQRARQLGADLQLESNPGLGARLLLRVPLPHPREDGPVA
jgi:signal transduction histidine kinase